MLESCESVLANNYINHKVFSEREERIKPGTREKINCPVNIRRDSQEERCCLSLFHAVADLGAGLRVLSFLAKLGSELTLSGKKDCSLSL